MRAAGLVGRGDGGVDEGVQALGRQLDPGVEGDGGLDDQRVVMLVEPIMRMLPLRVDANGT
jgi:hypothetical protein